MAANLSTEERLENLEMRVSRLETWAGPGQAQALTEGFRYLRTDLARVRQTLEQHTRELAQLRQTQEQHTRELAQLRQGQQQHTRELAELRQGQDQHTRMLAEITMTLAEVLRRLPPPPGDPGGG